VVLDVDLCMLRSLFFSKLFVLILETFLKGHHFLLYECVFFNAKTSDSIGSFLLYFR